MDENANVSAQPSRGGKGGIWAIIIILIIIIAGVLYFKKSPEATQPTVQDTKPQIAGTWTSVAPENMGGIYGIRDFTFTDNQWSLVMTAYGDQAATVKLFDFRASGPYTIGTSSAVVSDAYDAKFDFAKKELTLLTSDAATAKSLGMDKCGLKVGSTTDVSKNGCSFIPSVAVCGQEYDLLSKKEDGTLALGARPADNNMCTPDKRPTALGNPLKIK